MHDLAKLALGATLLIPGAVACGGSSSGGTDTGSTATTSGGGGAVQHPESLKGEVGEDDAYEISLDDPDGKTITNLAAGKYEVEVEDYSTIHDFHLTGNGVDESTTVGEKTTKTWTLDLKPGTYTFVCDPHSSQMHGTFTVS